MDDSSANPANPRKVRGGFSEIQKATSFSRRVRSRSVTPTADNGLVKMSGLFDRANTIRRDCSSSTCRLMGHNDSLLTKKQSRILVMGVITALCNS
jgi:hypothetical protein